MTDITKTSRMWDLAIKISDSSARADIECACLPTGEAEHLNAKWWDTTTADAEDREHVDEAMEYLELRGMLVRDALKPHVVTFKEPK